MQDSLTQRAGLGQAWTALLHAKIQRLQVPPLPGIDCNQCRMVQEGGFHPKARCCNIYPEFPNFLLGEILETGQQPGSPAQVIDWIRERRTDPTYAHKPPRMHEKYNNQNYQHVRDIPPCLLLDEQGKCTVYEQRPHTCISYNCVYPLYPEIIGFWHAFYSLLELHSQLTSRFLLHNLGIDVVEYLAQWRNTTDEQLWGQTLQMQESIHQTLWQGKEPASFYRACFLYILEHRDTIRDDVEKFRRQELQQKQAASGSNEDEGDLEPRFVSALEPVALEPPLMVWEQVATGKTIPATSNSWTLTEWEGFILWLHQAMMGRYSLLYRGQSGSP